MRRNRRHETRPESARHPDARRAWLAEAARLIVQPPGYPRDAALRRAAEATGIRLHQQADFEEELAEAIRSYRQLFRPCTESPAARLRMTAIEAMHFFEQFHPRVGGGLVDGHADEHDAVQLWLFPDSSKDVVQWMHEHAMPYDNGPDYVYLDDDAPLRATSLRVVADGIEVHLILLPGARPRDTLRRRRGEAGERVLTRSALARLIEEESPDGDGGDR